ncbi:hypothetical protein FB446DRAFT_152925 [Lentinula raphanica]|nr:hypothetical protein FB446DRAFT_152925 [Lentinula raphanica]
MSMHWNARNSSAHLPSLPEELWSKIIELTHDVPSDFISRLKLLSFDASLTSTLPVINMLPVILVCKMWYRLALPFLYKDMVLTDSSELQGAAETVALRPFGHHTTRLVLHMRPDLDDLYSLLLHLSNIEIVIIDYGHESDYSYGTMLSERILALPRLRLLCGPNFLGLMSTPTCPTLRAMTFPLRVDKPVPDQDSQQDPLPLFPYLSQLYFAYNISLSTIKYVTPDMRRDFQSVTSILIGYDYKESYLDLILCISGYLPNLRYIGIQTTFQDCFCEWGPFRNPAPIPSGVHTLGLSFRREKIWSPRIFKMLCQGLEHIHGYGLKVIRIDEDTILHIKSQPSIAERVHQIFQTKKWKLEVGDMYV